MPIWRTTVQTEYEAPGGPGYMTFHYRDSGGDPVVFLAEAALALRAAFTDMAAAMPTSTTFRHPGLWQEVDGPAEYTTPVWSEVGDLPTGNVLSGNNCVVIGWRTENRLRSGRGRTFVSGFLSSSSTDGTPVVGALNAARACAAEIISFNEGTANGAFVVYSRTEGVARDITGVQVRDVWASLRSRRD